MVTVVVLLCALGLVVVVGGGWLYCRRARKNPDNATAPSVVDSSPDGEGVDISLSNVDDRSRDASSTRRNNCSLQADSSLSLHDQGKGTVLRNTSSGSFNNVANASDMDQGTTDNASIPLQNEGDGMYRGHKSSVSEGTTILPGSVVAESGDGGMSPSDSCRNPARGLSVAQAVIDAAQELATMCTVPGVAEVAGLVIVLMNLLEDSSNTMGAGENMVKRCRSVLLLVQRAAGVLGEVGCSLSCAWQGVLSATISSFNLSVQVNKLFFRCWFSPLFVVVVLVLWHGNTLLV